MHLISHISNLGIHPCVHLSSLYLPVIHLACPPASPPTVSLARYRTPQLLAPMGIGKCPINISKLSVISIDRSIIDLPISSIYLPI